MKNNILFITDYKKKNRKDVKTSSIKWHSQRTKKLLEESGFEVSIATFNKNPLSLFSILTQSKKREYSSVLIQHEFSIFGGIVGNLMLLIVATLLRLQGIKVVWEVHQVTHSLKSLENYISFSHSLLRIMYRVGLECYYIAVGMVSNEIIVFDQFLKDRYNRIVSKDKIYVLSLFSSKKTVVNKTVARRYLGLPHSKIILLVFGYINGYKGIDWIIKTVKGLKNENIHLVIAGGKNPYHKGKKKYEAYYNSIVEQVKDNDSITHTGYIQDEDIQYYFSAVDFVIMPYTTTFSSSGAFTHAVSYAVPTLFSNTLKGYMDDNDFNKAMNSTSLTSEDMFFNLNVKSFQTVLAKAIDNNTKIKKFIKQLQTHRSKKHIGEKYASLLSPKYKQNPRIQFRYS